MKTFKALFSCIALFGVLLLTSQAQAQSVTIRGKVITADTGEPLPGANIVVLGTSTGTATDVNGEFRLTLTDVSDATLVVSFIGYKTQQIKVDPSMVGEVITITMEEDVLRLNEIVVTGLATSVARRNLANAVETVKSDELLQASTQTLERALGGKFPGVFVSQNTGAPGGGISVNLRGTTTIEGATQPLYVIDGVIMNNAANQSGIDLVTKATGAGSSRPQGQPTNRIADLNPNDIESIEVLKGASAAAIYGAKATNGVIIITTKRGGLGKTRIEINQQVGFNSLLKKIGSRRFTLETATKQYGDLGAQEFQKSGGKFIDYEDVMYGEKGILSETSISLQGGNNRTQFYVSGMFRNEDGIIKRTGYNKYSGRVNLSHKFSERLDIQANINFVRSSSDRGITGNDNSNTTFGFSLGFTPSFFDIRPKNGVYPDHLFNPSNPIHTRDVLVNNELVNRTIAATQINWHLYKTHNQSLDFIINGGVDFYNQENKVVSPPELQSERNADLPGASLLATTRNVNWNLYLNLAHRYQTGNNISFSTTAGVQFEDLDKNYLLTEARGLIVTQTNVDQAATINAFQDRFLRRERGFYVQEEINLQDRIYLAFGIRGDASSANGDPNKIFLFPKASASIRLSEYKFWDSFRSLSDEFKLRVAYGETGNLPVLDAKYTSLTPNNAGGKAGLLPATRRGAADIRPERTKELEMGFDAALFNERASLSFTFFNQNISDLFLIADLPPSSGFVEEVINGGKMRTRGVEISLGLIPLNSPNLTWHSRINFYKTSSVITQLDVDPFNKGGFATFLGTFRIQEGWSPTTVIGAEMETLPDGTRQHKKLGDATPDFVMSFNNVFEFGHFDLRFLWEWKNGGAVINLGKLITDLGGTTADYDETIVVDGKEMKKGDWRLSVLGTQTAPYVEDGSYWKLRELSLTYNVPRQLYASLFGEALTHLTLSIGGRNLLLFTSYTGYDPEVSQFGNVAIGRYVDTLPYPSSRSFYFNISLGL
ncbi:MAG: SusC/RagA family TonB-linked outer membrane protein [candidate division KSB1 bacterium]|nr:SusC/RagA family TonB-linked outer membrane protein [candidate division KSB1 bacterium]